VGVDGVAVLVLLDDADGVGRLDVGRDAVVDDAVLGAGFDGEFFDEFEGVLAAIRCDG
jgi:hypothetical protein